MVVLKSDRDPNQFVGISLWKSKEDAEKFLASQQWRQLLQEFRPLVQGDPIIRTFNVDASTIIVRKTKARNHRGSTSLVTHVLGPFCNASAKYTHGANPPRTKSHSVEYLQRNHYKDRIPFPGP